MVKKQRFTIFEKIVAATKPNYRRYVLINIMKKAFKNEKK